jgi:hypothetical protein
MPLNLRRTTGLHQILHHQCGPLSNDGVELSPQSTGVEEHSQALGRGERAETRQPQALEVGLGTSMKAECRSSGSSSWLAPAALGVLGAAVSCSSLSVV